MNIYGFCNWLSQQVCILDVVIVHAVQIRLTQRHLAVPRSGKKKRIKNLLHVFRLWKFHVICRPTQTQSRNGGLVKRKVASRDRPRQTYQGWATLLKCLALKKARHNLRRGKKCLLFGGFLHSETYNVMGKVMWTVIWDTLFLQTTWHTFLIRWSKSSWHPENVPWG